MSMLIADSQVHIWAANTSERPWITYDPPYIPHRAVPFTKDDLLREMDAAGVHRAIIVPPPLDGFRNKPRIRGCAPAS
jgi:L-fuconolactonase